MGIEQVRSADGSTIGFERIGDGPPVVLLHGGTADRGRWNPVREQLATSYELLIVDRRGRGASAAEADVPYDLANEAQDLAAVVAAVGAPAWVVAHSYGAIVALEAVAGGLPVAGLCLYEPAAATPGNVPVADEVLDAFEATLDRGDRVAALELFFTEVVGAPAAVVDAMRGTPIWEARLAAIHTALREGRAANAFVFDEAALGAVDVPCTVLVGTESPVWLRAAAERAAALLPGAHLVELEGQGHLAIDQAPDLFVAEVRAALSR